MSKLYVPDYYARTTETTSSTESNNKFNINTKRFVEVKSQRLNIRSGPSYGALVRCIVNHGEHLEIRTDDVESNGFIPVKTQSGITGWAAKPYIE